MFNSVCADVSQTGTGMGMGMGTGTRTGTGTGTRTGTKAGCCEMLTAVSLGDKYKICLLKWNHDRKFKH